MRQVRPSAVFHDPETGKPFELLLAEREFMRHAFMLDRNGRLLYPEMAYGAPKKSGKTTLAALIVLVMVLLRNDGRFGEAYVIANDLEQAQSRVFMVCRRIVEASPLLRPEAKITTDRITFPALEASIVAIASDAASAAGGNPTISCFDELWGYVSERSRRLWDEMITSPARKISCRLVVSYAGFSGESLLLEELHNRGSALPEIGPSLRAGDGMLFAWHTTPVAPWQDERWLAEMRRSLRPSAYARMIENRFVSAESRFVDLDHWDACVRAVTPLVRDTELPIWVGVDASTKRDSTAVVAVAYQHQHVRLVAHRVFTPKPENPLNFELTIERTLREWHGRFRLRQVLFDPYQMASVAQRLAGEGIPIEEYPMTVSNLTAATSNLFDLISQHQLILYPDADMRLAVARAIIVESARGWRLDKLKQSHKIDVVVALSMAALAAVRTGGRLAYDLDLDWIAGPDDPEIGAIGWHEKREYAMQQMRVWSGGGTRPPWSY
jgi:phage terminase large subunit-like protein